MTNKEIEQAEKELNEIEEMPLNEQCEPMKKWIDKYHVSVSLKYSPPSTSSPPDLQWLKEALENAHRFIQTKMMLNACNFSKLACKWAAIAAIVASIGVIASWSVFLHKMIIQILKGISNIF